MKFKKTIYIFLVLAVCGLTIGQSIKAQQTSPETYTVQGDASAGELNSARLDLLANEQHSSNERVFVIARLGRGETTRLLNLKRLQAARFYLVEMRGINKEQVIFAEGEKIAGAGRLEFYLGGKLVLVSLAARGKNVSLVCCVN